MAVTNQELFNIFLANPNMSDAQIVSLMETRGISPAQVSQTFGLPEGQIAARVGATLPPNQAVLLGDTWVQPNYQIIGSGENQQIGGVESVSVYKTTGGINDKLAVGTDVKNYTPEGEYVNTSKTKKDLSFLGGIGEALKDPFVQAALLGVAGGAGVFDTLFSGTPTALATESLTLGELGLGGSELGAVTNVADVVAATEGGLLTGGAEAATAFELANAGIAGGAATFTPAQLALIEAGATAAEVAAAGTSAGLLTGGKTAAELAALDLATGGVGGNAGATSLANALATGADVSTVTSLTGGSGALTGAAAGITAESVAQKLAADKVLTDAALAKKILDTGNTITSGLKTVGGLLQTEEDKAAAKLAADKVTAATQAGVEGSQFRPVGMTTRFGTSNYTYDPVTGRMTSAGYQLSPEAKNAQDRLVALTGRGLTQAEQAQSQFAPLQTAAQNLYSLGSQYIAKSPEEAAQDYINKQMQLLQPSRELDLANLQNRLFQQGRTGVSVAQGGSLGATTPELQALYNARAMQDLQLASQATQAGQANTLFGSNLYDLGTAKLSNYYGGQAQAYQPFTTALGQVQNLETQAQQPLTMGANLAQQASTAGFNAGRLGLQGASTAADLTTGKAATTNPYASLLSGIDPAFAAGIAKQIWGG